MPLSPAQTLAIIAAVALGTIVTRFLPFVLFPPGKRLPGIIAYLGKVLPTAMLGLLIVYCFRHVSFAAAPFGAAELAATAVIIALHCWRGNVLLSIAGGTLVYMLLVQLVF